MTKFRLIITSARYFTYLGLGVGTLSRLSLVIAMTTVIAADRVPSGHHRFGIVTLKQDDRVAVRLEGDSTIFIVTSPSGIGRMTIERADSKWPKSMIVRLNLKGLEGFGVSDGLVSIRGEVPVPTRGAGIQPRVWLEGQENQPMTQNHPHWISIRRRTAERKSPEPESAPDGYFELTLPPALFRESPKSISVSWVDFYRS